MSIQWYPGHMHKAGKEMEAALPGVDVVVEVLDARLPWSSANPALDARIGERPRLRVLTRADLADPALTGIWLAELGGRAGEASDGLGGLGGLGGPGGPGNSGGSHDAIATSTEWPETIAAIPARLRALAAARDAALGRSAARPGPRTAMIVGIPNVGKSTLINRLAGRAVAATGNEPAITKRQQSVPLGEGWLLRDTPGVLWPNVENPASGYRLAASGAVRDTAMDSAEVALWLIEHLAAEHPELLIARYGTGLVLHEPVATLEAIGRARGCLGGGALVDFDRAGRLVLHEFRNGMLGRVTLETPAVRDAELIATEARRVEREAARAAKLEARRKRRRKRA